MLSTPSGLSCDSCASVFTFFKLRQLIPDATNKVTRTKIEILFDVNICFNFVFNDC